MDSRMQGGKSFTAFSRRYLVHREMKLRDIPVEEFPQPIDLFTQFPQFHETDNSAVFRTQWTRERNAHGILQTDRLVTLSLSQPFLIKRLRFAESSDHERDSISPMLHKSASASVLHNVQSSNQIATEYVSLLQLSGWTPK